MICAEAVHVQVSSSKPPTGANQPPTPDLSASHGDGKRFLGGLNCYENLAERGREFGRR